MVSSNEIARRAGRVAAYGFVSGAFGVAFGYVYGKLADLPAGQVAKAWAVWTTARVALNMLVGKLIENRAGQIIAATLIDVTVVTIGIREMRKRGLLGEELMIFMIAVETFGVAINILRALEARKLANQKNQIH